MKKFIGLLALTSLFALTSCGGNSLVLYNNSNKVTDGDLTIRYEKSTEYKGLNSNISFSFYLYFLSKNPKPVTIKAKSAKIYREKDKAEYQVGSTTFMLGMTLELNCDIEGNASFSASLPTMTTEDNYYMIFEFNSKKLTCYFYDDVSAQNSQNSTSSSKK